MLHPHSVTQSQVVGQPTKVIQLVTRPVRGTATQWIAFKRKTFFLSLFFQISYIKIIIFLIIAYNKKYVLTTATIGLQTS